MSLNISDFEDNLYLGHLLFGLVEIPARTLVLFTVNRSRRLTQAGSLGLGGLACLVLVLVPQREGTSVRRGCIRTALYPEVCCSRAAVDRW